MLVRMNTMKGFGIQWQTIKIAGKRQTQVFIGLWWVITFDWPAR